MHRVAGITDKSAWFLTHRIREWCMRDGDLAPILRADIARVAMICSDEASHCTRIGKEFAGH